MNILLVDDSKSARYALRLQLQRHGIEVETADCAESAFELLKTQLPDAILMDHMMPGLNGFEALDVIRADPRTAAIPVVMCTSHEEADFVATANQKGVFGILPKSAAADFLPEILDRLRAHLGTESAPTLAIPQPPLPPVPAPPIVMPPPLPPVAAPLTPLLSEEKMLALVDERLSVRLATLLTPQLDALRHELVTQLASELKAIQHTQHQFDARLTAAAAPAPTATAPAALTLADLQALSTRLTTETLPELLKRSLELERALILEQVAQRWHELPPAPVAAAPVFDDTALLQRATAHAQRVAKETLTAALAAQPTPEAAPAAAPAMGAVYGLFVLATLLGVGAAAAVYFVLNGAGVPPL
jgi:CheY-like chemotaxis protein